MGGRQWVACAAQGRRDLKHAARIGADVHVRFAGQHERRLAIAERARRLRLDQVVDSGAAAAELLLRRLEELEARDRAQELPAARSRTRWAWPRWHDSWKATRRASG